MRRRISRWAYRAAHRLRLAWWWLVRPINHGVMVAAWCGPRVLIVQTSYRRALTLPGGFVRRGETLSQAAVRELEEEVGLRLDPDALVEGEIVFHASEGLQDHVHIFETELARAPDLRPDGCEVVHAWFAEVDEALELDLFTPVRMYLLASGRRRDRRRP